MKLAPPQAMTRIAGALRSITAGGLFDLAKTNSAPVSLQSIGMMRDDLEAAAGLAVSNPYWNLRPFGPEQKPEILKLLQRAF